MTDEPPQGIATKKPLGEILIQAKIITSEQLGEALHKQKTTMSHRKIGEILVRLGYIDKRHIIEALLTQNHDRSSNEIYLEVFGSLPSLDSSPTLVVHPVEMPKWKSPTLSVGVLTAYGNGGLHGALSGAELFRQADESNESLAKRAAKEIEQLALEELADNDARKNFEQLEDDAALDQALEEFHEQVGDDDSNPPEKTLLESPFDIPYDNNPPTEPPCKRGVSVARFSPSTIELAKRLDESSERAKKDPRMIGPGKPRF